MLTRGFPLFLINEKGNINSKTLIAIWESKMRKANAIKFTIYFLLFAIILYFEYYAIEMQEGEWIAHDDPCCCKPFLTFGAYYGLAHCRHLAHTKRNMNAQGCCRRI